MTAPDLSSIAAPRALLRWLEHHQTEMITRIRSMVEIESPSFDKSAVDRMGEFLASVFAAIGGTIIRHRQRKFGDHLQIDFASPASARHKPALLLGHFDTVWDLGTLRSMPCRVANDCIWGPGVLDMKAGIAQIIFAIRALCEIRGGLSRPVTVLLVTDEEVGSESSRPITEKLAKKSSAVFVLEPSLGLNGALKTARKGVGDYKIRVTGRAAHAGVDFSAGSSAILELARQVQVIEKFTNLKRGITVNPGVVRGGTRTNVVAAEAEAEIDVRIQKLSDAAILEKKFRGLKPFDKRCKLEIEGGLNRPPMERTQAIAALFARAQHLAKEMGWKLEEAATGGGSDGNFTAALGIPTLDGLGAVGEGAHAINESVLIHELPRRTALLAGLMEAIG